MQKQTLDLRQVLQALFPDLADTVLGKLVAISTTDIFRPETVLLNVGQTPDRLYVVHSGHIVLEKAALIGDNGITIEVLRAGDCFNLPAVMLERPSRLGAMIGAEQSVLIYIDARRLRQLVREEASFSYTLLMLLAQHHRKLWDHVYDLKARSVAQRLGYYLLTLAEEQGKQKVVLPFEKRLLAYALGTTPESLSRAFTTLRTCGVETANNRREVTLGDKRELCKYARADKAT